MTVCEHLDGRITILYGPSVVRRYAPEEKTPKNLLMARAPDFPRLHRATKRSLSLRKTNHEAGNIICYKGWTYSCRNEIFLF